MSKWILIRGATGLELIQECDLLWGPTALGSDVEFRNFLGNRVPGVILGMDRVKRRMEEELSRMRAAMEETGEQMEQEPETGRASRSRTRSLSRNSGASDSGPSTSAPRPMVGRPPRRQPTPRKRAVPSAAAAASPSATRRRLATPAVGQTQQHQPAPTPSLFAPTTGVPSVDGSDLLRPPGQGIPSLVPQSMLPQGFSLTGSPPLVLPTSDDPAEFRRFMVSSMVSMHQEMAGMKTMMLNMYLGFSPLLTQAANRATGAFQEVNGTKDRLIDLNTGIQKMETAMQQVSAHMSKNNEFVYEPFSTKASIDALDSSQNLTVLATDIEKEIYDENDQDDAADLLKRYKDRENKAKAKWLVDACLHRRLVPTSSDRQMAQRSIVERINHYAGIRRRAHEKNVKEQEKRDRLAASRKGGAGVGESETDGGDTSGMLSDDDDLIDLIN